MVYGFFENIFEVEGRGDGFVIDDPFDGVDVEHGFDLGTFRGCFDF